MKLWRISAFADLSGQGGLIANGRWHHAGTPVVYLTESPAAAMLEVLVHLEIDAEDIPDNLRLLRVDIPRGASVQTITGLPQRWEEQIDHTRGLGETWLRTRTALLLAVPSAVMPHTTNFLFNPLHPGAGQATVEIESLRFDRRLLRGL